MSPRATEQTRLPAHGCADAAGRGMVRTAVYRAYYDVPAAVLIIAEGHGMIAA